MILEGRLLDRYLALMVGCNLMKFNNCWCRKSSPIRFLQEGNGSMIYECIICHGSITVYLDIGEEWKERSSNEE